VRDVFMHILHICKMMDADVSRVSC